MTTRFLEVDHVSKNFPAPDGRGELCVFREVAFAIDVGEFVTMVGHSGCGKSTLLNIVAAEMLIGGTGIGYFVWNEWNNLALTSVIFAILAIGLIGVLLDAGLGRIARTLAYTE